MCLTCGCGFPADRHGDGDHLVLKRLQKAADAAGLPIMEAAWNIPRTLAAAGTGEGSPLPDRPALVFDCDGILAFTPEALCVALNARFGTAYSPQDQSFFPGTLLAAKLPPEQTGWLAEQMHNPAFVAAYSPDFRAFDALQDAWDAGYSVSVATERAPELADATTQWLHDWGAPPIPVHAVGLGQKPAWMTARYGPGRTAVLIDDNPAAAVTIARDGIEVWAPARPYIPVITREHVRRFTTWADVRRWLGLSPAV